MSESSPIVFGKPVEKLIDVVSRAMGVLYEPHRIKKLAKADAFKIIELAKAETLARQMQIELDDEFFNRMESKLLVREITRQVNVENIADKASSILMLEDSVSTDPVDEDWMNRFIRNSEDVADENMQLLWAKVLAGEIKHPKTYSLRTLEFLKNVSQSDSEVIMHLFKYILRANSSYFLFKNTNTNYLDKFNLKYDKIVFLRELGILQSSDMALNFKKSNNADGVNVINKNNIAFIKIHTDSGVSIPVYSLSTIGKELFLIADVVSDFQLLKDFANFIINEKQSISYSKITKIDGDDITYDADVYEF